MLKNPQILKIKYMSPDFRIAVQQSSCWMRGQQIQKNIRREWENIDQEQVCKFHSNDKKKKKISELNS